ncbi:unnamed protein product, partial [Mesorhabditis belari]|uniref:Uncharacterized protein n=1 Tax=Mesorhabditis belari TaxID=2138241 RepID=A0AAF3FCE6_9BILA
MSRLFGRVGKLWGRSKDRNKENEEPSPRDNQFHNASRRPSPTYGRHNRPTWHNCDDEYPDDRACYSNALAHRRQHPKGPKSCPVDIEEDRGLPHDRSFGTEFEFDRASNNRMFRQQERYSQRDNIRTTRNHGLLERSSIENESVRIQELESIVMKLQVAISKKDQKCREDLKQANAMKDEIEKALFRQLGRVRQERDMYKKQCRSLELRLENALQYQNLPILPPGLRQGSGFRGMQPDNTPSTSALESITGESMTTQSNCSFLEEFMLPVPSLSQHEPLIATNPFEIPLARPLELEERGDEQKDFRQRRSLSYSFHNDSHIEAQRSDVQSRLNNSGRAHSETILLEDTSSTTSTIHPTPDCPEMSRP